MMKYMMIFHPIFADQNSISGHHGEDCRDFHGPTGLRKTTRGNMSKKYISDRKFDKTDFSTAGIDKGDYENCTFENCNFSGVDLSGCAFADCIFRGCDLSLSKLTGMALRAVKFKDSKLLGLRFENCSDFLFSVCFDGCNLSLSSFYKKNLKKTRFVNCSLQETDFTGSDLTGSVFDNCDLIRTIFDHTVLEKADFCSSFNYSIDPEMNRIKKARFSLAGIAGLLDKYDIEVE
jgi:fluoroquinolone resistance protein